MTRMQFMDPDFRRDPKTKHFCCRCQKDIKPGAKFRIVRLTADGSCAIHPNDEPEPSEDMGWFPIGMDCARKIGMEFTKEPGGLGDG